MSTALSLTAYLEKEREYIPWSTALGHLGFIGSMLSMRSSYGDYEVNHLGRGRAKEKSTAVLRLWSLLFCLPGFHLPCSRWNMGKDVHNN